MSTPAREPGRVSVRWATESGSEIDFECSRVDEALAEAAKRWFPSNNSPNRMAMVVIVERDGEHMSDEEAERKIKDEFSVKRATKDAQ